MSETPRAHGSAEYVPGVGLVPLGRAWVTSKGSRAVLGDFADDITWRRNNRTIVTDDDGTVYVTIASDHGTATTAYHQHDPSPSFPRVLGHRDAGATHRVDAGSNLRRGWLGRFIGERLSGLARYQRGELVGQRGDGGHVRGRPDHGGGENSELPAGSERMRGLVKCEAPYHRLDCVGNCE